MIVSIVNQKGGSGKTTTAVNLSCALAKLQKRVLLIDFDSQGHIGYTFGISKRTTSISEVLTGEGNINRAIVQREGISVIPGDMRLLDLELNLADEPNKWFVLKQLLFPIRHEFDYIIIDCSPSLSLLTLNALCASERVIIPVQMSVLDVNGLEQINDTILKIKEYLNKDLSIMGVLPVIVDKRHRLAQEIFEYISDNADLTLFKQHIRSNIKAAEAPSFGKSVISYAPKSTVASDYINFAKEVVQYA
jgi:chromosome partitioning protein